MSNEQEVKAKLENELFPMFRCTDRECDSDTDCDQDLIETVYGLLTAEAQRVREEDIAKVEKEIALQAGFIKYGDADGHVAMNCMFKLLSALNSPSNGSTGPVEIVE